MFQITFAFSLASGTQILAAHWMGAGRTSDVDRLFWRTLRLGAGVAFCYAFLLWQAGPVVLTLFTEDPEILALASELLLISLVTEPARAVNIIGGFTLKTVGDTRFPMLLGLAFIWGILPVVVGIDQLWKLSLRGLWVCFAVDELVRACINAWRWKTGRWKTMAFASAP
jgi:Na+-driven multidrug efflux pump